MDLTLSRVGIFDVEPNRAQAVRRLLGSDTTECWYKNNQGLRFVVKQPGAEPVCKWSPELTHRLKYENGFDPAKKSLVIVNANLILTKHALQRWHQRAQQPFPSLKEIKKISDTMSEKALVDGTEIPHESDADIFYPMQSGALIAQQQFNILNWDSLKTLKEHSTMGVYQHNPIKRRIVGAFLPIEVNTVVKTYLGWDELKQGGTYNAFDWYKQGFAWALIPGEWQSLLNKISD